jgi:hypothetical protein
MDWEALAKYFLSIASISGVLAYVGKRAVDAYFLSRTETHKSELQRIAIEHSIRFQRLHTERGEVIKDLYAKLASLDDLLHSTLRSFQLVGETPLPEKVSQLSNKFNEFRDYFLPRRIFFDTSVCQLVDDILDVARGIFFDITTYKVDPTDPEYEFNRSVLKERHEFWEKARTAHSNQFAQLKHKLEVEFRALLGIGA